MAPGAAPGSAPAMSEAMRFEKLRAQDGKPLVPPPAMHGLLGPGGLDPAKAPQAQQQWQAAATELQTVYSFPAEERLYWCYFLLAALYGQQGRREEARQLGQQTLPLLREPRHQQIVLGSIARHCALLRDPAGAQRAQQQLMAQSDDLLIDTNYRFTAAYLATLAGDDQTVLQMLGYNTTDIPIADAWDKICAVLRANAHERQGRGEMAQQQLTAFGATGKGVAELAEMVQINRELNLIPRTLPAMQQLAQQMNANVVKTNSGISIGSFFILPIAGVILFGVGMPFIQGAGESTQMIFTIGATVGFIALSFFFVGRMILKPKMLKKRLAQTGADGTGKILAIERTGTRVNNQPMFRFRMLITVPTFKQPYMAIHHEIMAPGTVQGIPPGTEVPIKVDPKDPRQMIIAWR